MAISTPFPEDDFIRVELIPGSGRVIKFEVADGLVQSLSHQGEKFKKI